MSNPSIGAPCSSIASYSMIALVPTWFLSVYVLVVLLAPAAAGAWQRWGLATFWVPALAAAATDALFFGPGITLPAWLNYLFIWGAVHQLGFAWRTRPPRSAPLWLLGGLAALLAMTQLGPWPTSLVGVPGDELTNAAARATICAGAISYET